MFSDQDSFILSSPTIKQSYSPEYLTDVILKTRDYLLNVQKTK